MLANQRLRSVGSLAQKLSTVQVSKSTASFLTTERKQSSQVPQRYFSVMQRQGMSENITMVSCSLSLSLSLSGYVSGLVIFLFISSLSFEEFNIHLCDVMLV